MLKITKFVWLLGLVIFQKTLLAQSHSDSSEPVSTSSPAFNYTLGVRLKSNDISSWSQAARVRPIVGLSYGKWRVGIGDGQSWQSVGQYGTEPTLSYQFIEKNNLTVGLSMRVHNTHTGESFDVFESGEKTLRSRVLVHQKINRRWNLEVDWTQDLLHKGDSTAVNLGVSYVWPVFQKSELIINAGTAWGTADHWRNADQQWGPNFDMRQVKTGFEKVKAGVTFKQLMSKEWAWYASMGISQNAFELKKLQGSREITSGQIGILYFHKRS
jgi:hypothetical protein